MNRTNRRVCKNQSTRRGCNSEVCMCEQDYYRVCKNRTTGPQVEYVRNGPQVEYICTNRTISKVRMYEQDH